VPGILVVAIGMIPIESSCCFCCKAGLGAGAARVRLQRERLVRCQELH
jgi:hypothetical protein